MTWVARLLRHLHRVFDKGPQPTLAFRVGADGSDLVWEVTEDEFRTTITGGTAANLALDLHVHTVASLAAAIAAAPGYTIHYTNAEVADLAAIALIEGSASVNASNGDHVRAFTNPLWAYLKAAGYQIRDAQAQVGEMLAQLVVTQADGEWADLWGRHYLVPRVTGEADGTYTRRIIQETLRPKVNQIALEQILSEVLGSTVTVREPWKERFIPGRSQLSGPHRLQNGDFYIYNTLEVQFSGERAVVASVAMRAKAAGVLLWYHQFVELTPVAGPAAAALAAEIQELLQMLIVAGAIGPRSYASGGTVYDEWGGAYSNVSTFSATRLYTILGVGTGSANLPLHAGADWLPDFLGGLGYTAGSAQIDVDEEFFEPLDAVLIEVAQVA